MAKSPRLKFYGVECTLKEISVLAWAAYQIATPNFQGWHHRKLRVNPGSIYRGGAQGGVIEGLRKKGVFEYSERMRAVCWTRLGVDYIAAVARANKHMVIEESWDHKIRRTRREARKDAKNATC